MRLASILAALLFAAAISTSAVAQTGAPEDHYLVYTVLNPPTLTVPVLLGDQFIPTANYVTYTLDYFMTPVDKNGEGIVDPVTHYTWWRITDYHFGATCIINNQFGPTQPVVVGDTQYLLNPAIKTLPPNPPYTGPAPVKNHYLAYLANSPFPPNVPVSLLDQFGPLQAIVGPMTYLAPPAMKIFNGQVYPILDPVNHLAIYKIAPLPPVPPTPPIFATDEFGVWQLILGDRVYLAVPSIKSGVTDSKKSSWGQVKTQSR